MSFFSQEYNASFLLFCETLSLLKWFYPEDIHKPPKRDQVFNAACCNYEHIISSLSDWGPSYDQYLNYGQRIGLQKGFNVLYNGYRTN